MRVQFAQNRGSFGAMVEAIDLHTFCPDGFGICLTQTGPVKTLVTDTVIAKFIAKMQSRPEVDLAVFCGTQTTIQEDGQFAQRLYFEISSPLGNFENGKGVTASGLEEYAAIWAKYVCS